MDDKEKNIENKLNDLFSNPIHGLHGKEHQINTIINNNIIIYDYFDSLFNSIFSFFKN